MRQIKKIFQENNEKGDDSNGEQDHGNGGDDGDVQNGMNVWIEKVSVFDVLNRSFFECSNEHHKHYKEFLCLKDLCATSE